MVQSENSVEQTGWQRTARRIRVPSGFVFALLFVLLARPSPASMALSLLLVGPGLLLRGYASGYVKKNTELATSGPYAYTRNPLYLGSVLAAFGFLLAARRWELAVLLTGLLFLIYLPVILGEERFLRAHFSNFDSYAAKVPRLLPRLTPAPTQASSPSPAGHAGFSRELYRQHREYNASVGAVLLYLVLLGELWMRSHHSAL